MTRPGVGPDRRIPSFFIREYRKLPDFAAAMAELARAAGLQAEIWTQAVAASQADADRRATLLLLPYCPRLILGSCATVKAGYA